MTDPNHDQVPESGEEKGSSSDIGTLPSEIIEEAVLQKIEFWRGSIQEYERYKRHAYEFIPSPKNHEERLILQDNFGARQFFLVYPNRGEDSRTTYTYSATVDFENSLKQGIEALVGFHANTRELHEPLIPNVSPKTDIIYHYYYGLPVRKAKGKWLKNFLLRHFH